ncbi:MAG: hypothetical protein ACFFD4_16560 [Candidatus Odinarchaeota archaeon]
MYYRDLGVIEEEIAFLRKYQLDHLFFMCSEINNEGNEFTMKLADRILEDTAHLPSSWIPFVLINPQRGERVDKSHRC